MAIDIATLAVRLENAQAIAGAQATTASLDQMGVAGERASKNIQASASPMEQAILKQARATQQLAGATVASTHGMGALAALQAEAAGHVGEHSLALGRLERALGRVTEEAFKLNPALGLTIESFGKFAIGSVEMVAILAAMAAVSFAWEKLSEGARKSREETEKSIQALTELATKQRLGPNTSGDDAARASVELAKVRSSIDDEIDKLARMRQDPKQRADARFEEANTLMPLIERETLLTKLLGAHEIELAEAVERTRVASIEAEKAETDRHNAALFAAEDRIRLAKQELTLASLDAQGKAEAKSAFDAETARIQEQRRAIDDAFEDRIRLAKQATQLVGLDADATKRVTAEQEKINAAIKARRAEEVSVTDAAAKTEEEYGRITASVLGAIEASKTANDELKKAQADIEQRFKDMFDRIVGHGKSVFQMLAREIALSLGQQGASGLVGLLRGGDTGALSNGGIIGAVFGGAAAGGAIGYGVGSATGSKTAGALSGAASGALVGAELGGPWGAAIGGVVGFTAGILGATKAAKEAAKALDEIQRTEIASTLASWRAEITGTAADQRAAAALELKMKYLNIQADIERLEAGKKNEVQRNKDLTDAADLYAKAQQKLGSATDAATASMLNFVQGYKLQATIFQSATARSGGVTTGGLVTDTSSGDLTVNVQVDADTVSKVVLRGFKRRAQKQYGDSTKWSSIQ